MDKIFEFPPPILFVPVREDGTIKCLRFGPDCWEVRGTTNPIQGITYVKYQLENNSPAYEQLKELIKLADNMRYRFEATNIHGLGYSFEKDLEAERVASKAYSEARSRVKIR